MSGWRCFVAVPIGTDLRRALARSVDEWRSTSVGERLRWTDPDGWHVTLAFLGATDPEHVATIRHAIAGIAGEFDHIDCPTTGLGAFPSPNAARVVAYRLADPDGRLTQLALRVRRTLDVDDGARFRPHVTLARTRGDGHERLGEWLRSLNPPVGVVEVDHVELYRSHLGGGPARYESLASIPLRERAAARA